MIFSKKNAKTEMVVYTEMVCSSCGVIKKRRFRNGDTVFGEGTEMCNVCGGTVRVERVFGEKL